jgi:hypothetical protein
MPPMYFMFYRLANYLEKAVFRVSYFRLEDSHSLTTYVEGVVINYILIRIKRKMENVETKK